MEDSDDLGTYNGDVGHDMWVDFDNFVNTGDPDVFGEGCPDDFDDAAVDDWA